MPTRLAAVMVTASALFVGACGGSGSTNSLGAGGPSTLPSVDGAQTAPATDPGKPPSASAASVLPDLVVDDVSAGTKVNLTSLVPSPEPLLVWFWAPH